MAIALLLAQKSRSRQLVAAAHIVTLAWCFTFFWHYLFHGSQITWGYAVIDASVAVLFWRQAQQSVFTLPLFYVHVACVFLYFATTALASADWWVMALTNRFFEVEVFYLIGCALFRMARRRSKEKGAPKARPNPSV